MPDGPPESLDSEAPERSRAAPSSARGSQADDRLWAQAWTFLRLVAGRASDDAITLKSAALAFVTFLALIPLLAAFSFIGTRAIDRYQEKLLDLLSGILPYGEAAILEKIDLFVHQAESLQGLGLVAFILVGLGAFHTIEETINKIWRASSRRSIRAKILSFTLVVFWGPLLIGSTLSLFVVLGQRPELEPLFRESRLVRAIPFLVTAMGLTMLHWQVPRTRVRFRSALAGGLLAALLVEVLRQLFGYYVSEIARSGYVVYGSFALSVFFMISVQLSWWAVLLGAEVAYVSQYFDSLRFGRSADPRFEGPWIGLAILAQLAGALRGGSPVRTHDDLATVLRLSPGSIEGSLLPLRAAGLVVDTGEGLVLAREPDRLPVGEVLACYDGSLDGLLERIPVTLRERMEPLLVAVRDGRTSGLAAASLGDLLPPDPG